MAEKQTPLQLFDALDGYEMTKSEYEWLERRFSNMTEKERILFLGAMEIDPPQETGELIGLTCQLHRYELYYGAGDMETLGQFVLDQLNQVSAAARPYLSPAHVGEAYLRDTPFCTFCEGSFIRRTSPLEPIPAQNLMEQPETGEYAIRIKLASRNHMEGVWAGFPDTGEAMAPNAPDELLLALDALCVESLGECIVLEADCCLPQLTDIVSQYDSAGELARQAIDFGYVWAEQGQGAPHWLEKWQAVLELEDCHRLDLALDLAQNLHHFEFFPRGVELTEYGREMAVRDGVIPKEGLLNRCFDGEAYAEAYLQTHGLSATEHGYVAWNGSKLLYEYSSEGGNPIMSM